MTRERGEWFRSTIEIMREIRALRSPPLTAALHKRRKTLP